MDNRKRQRDEDIKQEQAASYPEKELPFKCRSLSNLLTSSKPNNHDIVFKKPDPEKKHHSNPTKHYYKIHQDVNLTQLEAYSTHMCRLLAGEEYVPSSTIYYDEDEEIHGIASKELKGFHSLHDDPLRERDMKISLINIQNEHQKNILLSLLTKLITHYNVKIDARSSVQFRMLLGCQSPLKQFLNKLTAFQNTHDPFSSHSLANLNHILMTRKLELDPVADSKEFNLINAMIQCIEKIDELKSIVDDTPISIETLDNIDNHIKSNGIDIHHQATIDVNIEGHSYHIKSEDLLNYRILKGSAISLVTRYIFKEGDNHACNSAKDGKIIDFDMTKLPLSFKFKTFDYALNKILRKPKPNTFICTAKDIREFPDITDADFYYWPTKQTGIILRLLQLMDDYLNRPDPRGETEYEVMVESIKEFIIEKLGIRERNVYERFFAERAIREGIDEKLAMLKPMINQFILSKQEKFDLIENSIFAVLKKSDQLFTVQDNEAFKQIGLHPVFEYFKYKTFLKFLLLNSELYHFNAKLCIRKSAAYLREAAVEEDMERRNEIESILIAMPEFQTFIASHGHTLFQQIINELSETKEKYKRKAVRKPYYQEFVDAIDLDKIKSRFESLTGMDMTTVCDDVSASKQRRHC